jgi:predicted hydrocarbon binding protein
MGDAGREQAMIEVAKGMGVVCAAVDEAGRTMDQAGEAIGKAVEALVKGGNEK